MDIDSKRLKKLDISRIGHVIDLDQYKINETIREGKNYLISSKFYNKGVYRVRNLATCKFEDFAIYMDKIGAFTYEGLVEELGKDCVDKKLWEDVPEGEVIFFYSFHVEKDLV